MNGDDYLSNLQRFAVEVKYNVENLNPLHVVLAIALGFCMMMLQKFNERMDKKYVQPAVNKPRVALDDASQSSNPAVYFDVSIGGVPSGRIIMELFATICPRTAENFRCLCTGEKGARLHYKGCTFHRIIPGFVCQAGDFTLGDGHGGESIYGGNFEDEWNRGVIGHTVPYLLSMANGGPNTNASQFFITTRAPISHLDGKHVVFGQVIGGTEVVRAIEAVGSKSGDPQQKVVIASCGQAKQGGKPGKPRSKASS